MGTILLDKPWVASSKQQEPSPHEQQRRLVLLLLTNGVDPNVRQVDSSLSLLNSRYIIRNFGKELIAAGADINHLISENLSYLIQELVIRNNDVPLFSFILSKAYPTKIFQSITLCGSLPLCFEELWEEYYMNHPDLLKIATDISDSLVDNLPGELSEQLETMKFSENTLSTNALKSAIATTLIRSMIVFELINQGEKTIVMSYNLSKFLKESLETLLRSRTYFNTQERSLNIEGIQSGLLKAIRVWQAQEELSRKQEMARRNEIAAREDKREEEDIRKELKREEKEKERAALEKERFDKEYELQQQQLEETKEEKMAAEAHQASMKEFEKERIKLAKEQLKVEKEILEASRGPKAVYFY